ncbi:hypothetical protein F5Y16DRAFT_357989 [Xylariaceae sp. FL0255]|nr:hypothetical protein F5Y16DRAFT_357989 [Xylariaceae sp. FL0255]
MRKRYLPITPSPKHPDNGICLVLRNGRKMRKRSWVNTQQIRSVSVSSLDLYDRDQTDFFLDIKSYKILIAHSGYIEQVSIPNITLPVSPVAAPPEDRVSEVTAAVTMPGAYPDEADPIAAIVARWIKQQERLAREQEQERRRNQSLILGFENRALHAEQSHSAAASQLRRDQRLERQPLLTANAATGYRSTRSSRHISVLPTSHPVSHNSGHGQPKGVDWERVGVCIKIIAYICACLGVSYGVYLVGVWAIDMATRAVYGVKHFFESLGLKAQDLWSTLLHFFKSIGLKVQDLWSALLKKLGLA